MLDLARRVFFTAGGGWLRERDKFIAFTHSARGVRREILMVLERREHGTFIASEANATIDEQRRLPTFQILGEDGRRRITPWRH